MGRWDICLKLLLRECTQEVLTWILPVFETDQEMVAWIERRFTAMHDFLIEESIMYKELVKEGEIKGIGIGQRRSIEAVVRAHFPDLLDLARKRVARVHDEQQLDNILLQLIAISTEAGAHRFLMSLPE